MIFGTCKVENGRVRVSKTSYPITQDTHTDVRRVFLAPALVGAGGLALFGIGFFDLLYGHELVTISLVTIALLWIGFQLARLVILDRVTRGTDQMSAVYGFHSSLQQRRAEIDAAVDQLMRGAK